MRVAIIGIGLQCGRRAPVIQSSKDDQLIVVCGVDEKAANAVAQKFDCEAMTDWKTVVARADIDAVIISTPPDVHKDIAVEAMRNGKHVLCEKPLCRTMDEAEAIAKAVKETGRIFKCGFNHRYHPAVWEAKRLADAGEFGKPIFARCRYGLIGRPGYENEWRAMPSRAVGGQLAEQGIHGMDLFRWFMGEIDDVACMTSTQYFHEQPMEDNGMATFRMKNGSTASLHSSLTQWKNLFSFEFFGEDGYAIVEGLGGAYGVETLTRGKRDFNAPFADTITEYRGGDVSWANEWKDFTACVQAKRQPTVGSVEDGVQALRVTLACYQSNRDRRFVKLDEIRSDKP